MIPDHDHVIARLKAENTRLRLVLNELLKAWNTVSADPDGDWDCAGGINQEHLWEAARAALAGEER